MSKIYKIYKYINMSSWALEMGGLWSRKLLYFKTYKVLEQVKVCWCRIAWAKKSKLWFSWASRCWRKRHHSGISHRICLLRFARILQMSSKNPLLCQCFFCQISWIWVILGKIPHFLFRSAYHLSLPLFIFFSWLRPSITKLLLSSPLLSFPQRWDRYETPLVLTEVGCVRHSAGPISDDLHGNVWQGRYNEVPSLPAGRLSSGVLSDLSPLSRARTARTCPSQWSPGTGVEQSQIRDGRAEGPACLQNMKQHTYIILKQTKPDTLQRIL